MFQAVRDTDSRYGTPSILLSIPCIDGIHHDIAFQHSITTTSAISNSGGLVSPLSMGPNYRTLLERVFGCPQFWGLRIEPKPRAT